MPIPPTKQNTYYFTIEKFNRQPSPPQYIKDKIKTFTKKPKSKWTQEDSLYYAYEKVHLEEFGFALSIFSRVNVDTLTEPHAQQLYRTSLLQTKRYGKLLDFNKKVLPKDTNSLYSVRNIILKLNEAYIQNSRKSKHEERDTIFNYLFSKEVEKINSSRRRFRRDMVDIAKNLDTALRYFTFLHDKRDAVLSQAYEEFGDFQNKYFYISNSYLCYAIARHYYRNNKDLASKYNRAIDEIAEKNYLLPSFRTVFGKVIDNRYQLSEEITELKKDTINPKETFNPPEIEQKKDYIPWLDVPLIIMIGIFIVLLIVIIFLKSDREKQ
jgi:hypothetical protein